ncbi:hypothetical protein PHSY_003810 [Pseudozyma hubeiensis SY62]|uniref:Uncharacterized protein n=1 Tax=Pseudozyma hubeiensis (strain SY62) TaxID=1305764 RepID=R9PDR0_PSEHS|nr:hypothetical protein PHSY_003810 [Pseudozyma hubeiensis SY62]GAC96230.1 hypothetical protein PHSY_003810 [Pseudozyma hubeiensis SY62]
MVAARDEVNVPSFAVSIPRRLDVSPERVHFCGADHFEGSKRVQAAKARFARSPRKSGLRRDKARFKDRQHANWILAEPADSSDGNVLPDQKSAIPCRASGRLKPLSQQVSPWILDECGV